MRATITFPSGEQVSFDSDPTPGFVRIRLMDRDDHIITETREPVADFIRGMSLIAGQAT